MNKLNAINSALLPVIAISASLMLTGCALNHTADRQVADALEHYRQSAADDATRFSAALWRAPATQPATLPAETEPSAANPPASLCDYILLALRENPDIQAAAEAARAKAAHVPQVTALPDPMLATKTLPEPVRTAEGDNYFVLGVQQKFPVPEKLDRAGRVALQEARMALQDLQQVRLRVIADVKRAYFRLYIIDMSLEIDVANKDLLRGLIEVVRAQVAAGRRSQADALRAEVELWNLEGKLIELRQQRGTSAALLNRALNRPPTTPVPKPAPLDLRRVDLRLAELLAAAAAHNPDLQRLKEQIEREQQALKLARLAYWPDFTLGFEWMYLRPRAAFIPPPNPQTGVRPIVSRLSEDGSDNWAVTFGINIPLWLETIEGGIREAHSRLRAAQHQYTATRDRVQFQIEDALERVRAQQGLAELFDSTIIPQARQAYEVSRAAYTSGTTDFLFVIDNWQKWLTFTIQYHRALGELERSIADLEEAIGLSLDELEADE